MYMHFWYAMHRHLWWCLVGAISIVQCIFGALFLGLGCNIFLMLRLWCYALSAKSRRLATAMAHLLYNKHDICYNHNNHHLGRLVEYCHLKVTCLTRVIETGECVKKNLPKNWDGQAHKMSNATHQGETWSGEEDFLLDKPRLSLLLEGEAFRRRQVNYFLSASLRFETLGDNS